MKKKDKVKQTGSRIVFLTALLTAGLISACGSQSDETSQDEEESAETEETIEVETEEAEETEEVVEEEAEEETQVETEDETLSYDGTEIRVGSLKGPTTMGIVNLMDASDNGESVGNYTFTMASEASEIVSLVSTGDLDIGMIPANLAATLYSKTEGGVCVIDINTLGVLYGVTADESISSIADLAGKTVLTTGQGATPEYALNYLLEENGITDCTLEFYSESTEIAALLLEDPDQIAVLPQPFVTSAEMQNEELRTVFSLTDEWDAVTQNGSMFLTGATVVSRDFLEEHEDAVQVFMAEHEDAANKALDDIDGTAQLVVDYGILDSVDIARAALPECNIVCITGDEMQTALSGYLEVLYEADASSVGGAMPDEEFYYLGE